MYVQEGRDAYCVLSRKGPDLHQNMTDCDMKSGIFDQKIHCKGQKLVFKCPFMTKLNPFCHYDFYIQAYQSGQKSLILIKNWNSKTNKWLKNENFDKKYLFFTS